MSPHSLTPGLMLYAKQDCPAIYRLTVRMQTVFNHCLSRETQAVTRSHTTTLTVMHAQSQTNTHCRMQSQTALALLVCLCCFNEHTCTFCVLVCACRCHGDGAGHGVSGNGLNSTRKVVRRARRVSITTDLPLQI